MDKPLSVGVVGICENGLYAVCACDEMLTYGQQTAEVGASKMMWYGDWAFIFAGALSSTDLTVEEVRIAVREDDKALHRNNIQATLRQAYTNRVAHWNEIRHLVPFGMTMQQFNSPEGRKGLGSKQHYELGQFMQQDYVENFSDQILVLGWGKTPLSVMLYSIGPDGEGLHGKDGSYAIGSGSASAISTLFLLEHKASTYLQDAIYAVAAAKFSSEAHGIGKNTRMWIGRKRIDTDPIDHPPGMPELIIQKDEIAQLRSAWERHGRPRVPIESRQFTKSITARTKDDAVLEREGSRDFYDSLRRSSESE
jgi:hypothetical protein